MRSHNIAILLLAFSISFFSCNTAYHPSVIQYQDYRITNKQTTDSKMNALVKPYADSVHIKMNVVVAEAGMELEKKQPEGTLGNVLADAVLFRSREIYKVPVDAAFYQSGGIRLSSIPPGPISLGEIFELGPFDNRVVLLTLNGEQFQQFLNLIASRGGWPCSGIKFKIKNNEAIEVEVNQIVLDPVKKYTIALNDYLANGGDDCSMLKTLERKDNGYMLRDAIVDYLSSFRKNGKKVASTIQNRIINVQ
jgi:hypothetical protein